MRDGVDLTGTWAPCAFFGACPRPKVPVKLPGIFMRVTLVLYDGYVWTGDTQSVTHQPKDRPYREAPTFHNWTTSWRHA